MGISERDFFREISLRICSSLEIDKALERVFFFVRKIMPADQLLLGTYNEELGILEITANIDEHGGSAQTVRVPYSDETRKELAMAEALNEPLPILIDDHRENSLSAPVGLAYNWPPSSLLTLRLRVGERHVGFLALRASGQKRYTAEHGMLWGSINEPAAIALANYLTHRELFELKERLADDNTFLQDELRAAAGTEIIGADFGLKEVMHRIQHVAPLASPVFLQGETGTGKEVIANAIHNLSPRSKGPFIKVNCGAIPETLIDSELFGHEKGAFTGAITRKKGRFERAHGGTIFLDEIGELPLQAQVRLLRVLQEKEIERVGGTESIKVDIRVISGTHRDIEKMVKEGQFREDLYFRLKVFPVTIPPLRERKPDIPVLIQHILTRKSSILGLHWKPTLAPGALDRLLAYDWPGNVRELENAVERALILSHGEALKFLDFQGRVANVNTISMGLAEHDHVLPLDHIIRNHIRQVLDISNGRVEGKGGAAALLHLNPSTLRHKMRQLAIPFGRKIK